MTTRVMIFGGADQAPRCGGAELLGEQVTDGWRWIDIENMEPDAERALLTEDLGIAELAVQDAQRERHPPKLEIFDDYSFLLLRMLTGSGGLDEVDSNVEHVSIFFGGHLLLTRRARRTPSIDQVWQEAVDGRLDTSGGPAHGVFRICRVMVDEYTPVVLALEARLAELEDEMFERPSDDLLEALSGYNRILKRLRRTLAYQHGIMTQLAAGRVAGLQRRNLHEFNDIAENMERLTSLCQLNQELAVDLINGYLSLASHRLNQITRVLTITAVIFLPLGLLAGIYGMNFDVMPELHWRYAYFTVLGVMVGVATTLIAIFRRLKWL